MVMSSDPVRSGGVQEHILHLSTKLQSMGHDVTIFGPPPKKNRYFQYHTLGRRIQFPLPNNNYGALHIPNETDKPEELFVKNKFDILHIHEPYMPFAAWNIFEKSRIPTIGTFHTTWDNESFFNIFNPFISLLSDKFSPYFHGAIFVSRITFDKWKALCTSKVILRTIPNAVDTRIFVPKESTNSIVQLLFAARIVHRKGLMGLLRALVILKKRNVLFFLTIMGDGEEKSQCINFCRNHKLQGYVTFLGEINGKKRAKYFTNADIFCAPYVNEASSISVLEAVSTGLPVVGYKIPLFSDLLNDYPGKELLVKKNDAALAGALEKIIQTPLLSKQIKNWCIKKRKEFSWKAVAKKTEGVYYKVIKQYEKKNI